MYIRRQLSMTKYWLKILQSHENSLLFKTYKMLITLLGGKHTACLSMN